MLQSDFWAQKLLKCCNFWAQKLQESCNFWAHKLQLCCNLISGPRNCGYASIWLQGPEIADMLQFLGPEIAVMLERSYIQLCVFLTNPEAKFESKSRIMAMNAEWFHFAHLLNCSPTFHLSKCWFQWMHRRAEWQQYDPYPYHFSSITYKIETRGNENLPTNP